MNSSYNINNINTSILAILVVILAGSQVGIHFDKYFKITIMLLLVIQVLLIKRYKYPGIFLLIMVMLILWSNIVSAYDSDYDLNIGNIVRLTFLLLAYYFINTNNLTKILDKYSSIIYLLIIISLIAWPISIFFPDIIKLFPLQSYSLRPTGPIRPNIYYNAILFTTSVDFNSGDFRNRSIFWEPSVFAVNMSISFVWSLIYRKRFTVLRYIIYLLGFITCLSASGIVLITLLTFSIIYQKQLRVTIAFKMIIVVTICVVLGYLIMQHNTILFDYVINKFNLYDPISSKSFRARLGAFESAYNIYKTNPLLGIGLVNSIQMTNSFTGMSYQLGVTFTLIYMYFNVYIFKCLYLPILIPFYLLLVFSQHFFFSDIFILLTALGLQKMDINKFRMKYS
jgi:hypothetical protein